MTSTAHYTAIDRVLHRAAFAGIGLQKAVADVEDTIFGTEIDAVAPSPPVFICSLPRAGTTLVLELFNRLPELTTHTYRHMPFLLCPMLWDKISSGFRRPATLAERAHGDGVAIGYDSPEAFEEAIWRAFWPSKYSHSAITPWTAEDRDDEFETFFRKHLLKLIAVRRGVEPRARRYVSKNNGNIARIPYLLKLFPDARIVVPVRDPLEHIRSLHRQHSKFLATHRDDAFARNYMGSIGHFDFGANLKPIQFADGPACSNGADQLPFWLDYWIAAFSALASQRSSAVMFASYEALRAAPGPALDRLLSHIGANQLDLANALAAHVREPVQPVASDNSLDPSRLALARDLYRELTASR